MGRRCVGSVAPIVGGGTWVTMVRSAFWRRQHPRGGMRSRHAMRRGHGLGHPGVWRMEAVPSSLRLRNQRQTRGVDCRDMTTHLEGDVWSSVCGVRRPEVVCDGTWVTMVRSAFWRRQHPRGGMRSRHAMRRGHGLGHPGVWRMEAVPSSLRLRNQRQT